LQGKDQNCSKWAQDRLTQLLNECSVNDSEGKCRVTQVQQIRGDLTVFVDKRGKRGCSYDLEVLAEFEGQMKSGKILSGELFIPHIGEEYAEDEFEIQFNAEEPLRTFARDMLDPVIRNKVIQMLKELCDDYEIGKSFAAIKTVKRPPPKPVRRRGRPVVDLEAKGYKTIGGSKAKKRSFTRII